MDRYHGNQRDSGEQFSLFGAAFWYHVALHAAHKAQLVVLNAGPEPGTFAGGKERKNLQAASGF